MTVMSSSLPPISFSRFLPAATACSVQGVAIVYEYEMVSAKLEMHKAASSGLGRSPFAPMWGLRHWSMIYSSNKLSVTPSEAKTTISLCDIMWLLSRESLAPLRDLIPI